MRRVTIKQLLTADEAQGGSFCIAQKPLGKVCPPNIHDPREIDLILIQLILVANVYKNHVIKSKSKVSYGFDDGSGRIRGSKADTGFAHQTFA